MKKAKFLSFFLSIFTIFSFISCNSEQKSEVQCEIKLLARNRAEYYTQNDAAIYSLDAYLTTNSDIKQTKTGKPGSTVSFTFETEGNYTIAVKAYLEEGMTTLIAEGSTTVDLLFANSPAKATVKLTPKEKPASGGQIDVTIEWETPTN